MLKKLLKYDLKNIYKSQIILYIITLIFAITMDICNLKIDITIFRIIYYILGFITITLIFAIIINNITRLWIRFIKNIYQDESYLTHTLPITKNQIYLSKLLTTIITIFTSLLVIVLVILIIIYPLDGLTTIKNMLETIEISSSILPNIIVVFTLLIIEITYLVQIGYTGIILGHRSNNNKIINSIIYGAICYIIISVLSLLIVFIIGLTNQEIIKLFAANETPTKEVIKILITGIISMYTVFIIIFYFINIKLLKKGVNID